jgi:hypothetical protein
MHRFGNLASLAWSKWLTLVVGSDSVYRSAVIKEIEYLRSKFPLRANPTSRFLVERIIMTWLKMAYAENRMADLVTTDKAGFEFFSRAQEKAQRQHMQAIRAWEHSERPVANMDEKLESSSQNWK